MTSHAEDGCNDCPPEAECNLNQASNDHTVTEVSERNDAERSRRTRLLSETRDPVRGSTRQTLKAELREERILSTIPCIESRTEVGGGDAFGFD